jgi:methylated-DNA-[protein]-cysteine S-methyltransferase
MEVSRHRSRKAVEETMKPGGFAVFETAVGPCGIAWGARGVGGVQLPEDSVLETRARMAERFPAAIEAEPPAEMRIAIDEISGLLRGERRDLLAIQLDWSDTGPFDRRVYEAARAIPMGSTATYGEIAERVGEPGAARAVGQALGRNPFVIVIPCHRVVGSGWAGGFSANGGLKTKARLLEIEGADNGQGTFVFAESPEREDEGERLPARENRNRV